MDGRYKYILQFFKDWRLDPDQSRKSRKYAGHLLSNPRQKKSAELLRRSVVTSYFGLLNQPRIFQLFSAIFVGL